MEDLILQKAKLKLLDLENQKPPEKDEKKERNDMLLLKAIEDLENLTDRMEKDIENIKLNIREILANKEFDKFWEVRVNYAEFQIEVIKATYPEYERIARERKAHYLEVERTGRWAKEKELCKQDTHYWYKWWAWTVDPRVSGFGWALPFIPYDFQKEAIDILENHIFVKQSDLLFEKSRDMGFSWILMSVIYKHWQFQEGGFHVLVGSMTIDDTDVVGNPSTLFEKIRLLSALQPKGLLPKGFKGEIPYVKCINPENGNSIVGEPCNETFGRGGRYKCIIMDELSAVKQDTEALTACSQSSNCKIYNATVRGMGNEFAQLRFSGAIPVYTYHWTRHPSKDERWYKFQKMQLNSETRVAQELDIDYTASTPNRVYPDWNEVHHIVTKSEVMRALPRFRGKDGKFTIPFGHNIAMGEDVSMMDGCKHVLLWFVTLREGTTTIDGQDLTGSVLCYREVVMPPKSTPRKTANKIKDTEDIYEQRMIMDRLISHEAITEREIYEDEHNLIYRHWKTDYWEGISRVRDYLEIQGNEPHPFRDLTRFTKFGSDSPEITGTPKIFFVVDDEYGELNYDQSTKKYWVTQPKPNTYPEGSMWRIRQEFPIYHFPTEELGKEVLKMRPKKISDDAMDVLRCVASEFFAPISRMTTHEKALNSLPERLTDGSIKTLTGQDQQIAIIQQVEHLREFYKKQSQQNMNWRDKLYVKGFTG